MPRRTRRRTKKMKRQKGGRTPVNVGTLVKKLLLFSEQKLYEFYYKAKKLSGEEIFTDNTQPQLDGTYGQYAKRANEVPDEASKWVVYVNDLVDTLRNSSTEYPKASNYATILEKLNGVNLFDLFTLRFFPTSPLTTVNRIPKENYVVKKDIRLTTDQVALTMDDNYRQSPDSEKRGSKGDTTIEILESYPEGVFVKWLKDIYGIENMFYLMNTTFKNDKAENKNILDNIEKNKVVKTIPTATLVPTYNHFANIDK
tara:strand:+ start:326 stop:1093 length:768 start_codon:yes stop_codon:yes gene_type:complete